MVSTFKPFNMGPKELETHAHASLPTTGDSGAVKESEMAILSLLVVLAIAYAM